MKKITLLLLLFSWVSFSQITMVSGTDDQTLRNFQYNEVTKILSIEIEDGNVASVDLTPLINSISTGGNTGGGTGTDDQIITDLSLSGNTLSITLENGNTRTVDLSSLVSSGGSTADGSETKINAGNSNITITGSGTDANPYVISAAGGNGGSTTVEDVLTSSSTTNALSARQGGVLKSQIDALTVGTGNPNVAYISSQADLIDANNAGKRYVVTADFSLTSDVTLPTDLTITDEGDGTVDVGNFEVTFQNTKFDTKTNNVVFDFSEFNRTTVSYTTTGGETTWDTGVLIDEKFKYKLTVNGVEVTEGSSSQTGANFFYFHTQGATTVLTFRNTFTPVPAAGLNLVLSYVPANDYARISDASTFQEGRINVNNFGLVADGDLDANTGTDNRNVWLQAQKIYNSTGSEGWVGKPGTYMSTLVVSEQHKQVEPFNLFITGKAKLSSVEGVVLGKIIDGLEGRNLGTDYITLYRSEFQTADIFEIRGNKKNHIYPKPVGLLELTAGTSGSVTSVTVGGSTITSGAVAFDTDLATTASNIAANINAHTSSPFNYTAYAFGDHLYVANTFGNPAGNNMAVSATVTGDITFTGVNTSGGRLDEHSFGIQVSSRSNHVTLKSNTYDFTGDGYICNGAAGFFYINQVVEGTFPAGQRGMDLNPTTGALEANSKLNVSNLWDISGSGFVSAGGFAFSGGSFGGNVGLGSDNYYVAYYDATATNSDTTTGFLGMSDILQFQRFVEIDTDKIKQIRLIIYTPPVWANLGATIAAPTRPRHVTFSPREISGNVRQGISNPGEFTRITGIDFNHNGVREDGTKGSPGYHVDLEDGFEKNSSIEIDNCTFINAGQGHFTAVGPMDVDFHDNQILYHTTPGYDGNIVNFHSIYNGKIYNNRFEGATVTIGRQDNIYNNLFTDCEVFISLEEEIVKNNRFLNSPFGGRAAGASAGITYVEDNTFEFTRLSSSNFVFSGGGIVNIAWRNNIIDGGGMSFNTTTNRWTNTFASNYVNTGSIDNMIIKNITSASPHFVGHHMFVHDINLLNSSVAIEISAGLPRDATLSNSNIADWIHLEMNDYPNTDTGEFTTYYIKNTNIVKQTPGALLVSRKQLTTNDRDFNLVVEDSTFDLGDETQVDNFMTLNHNGTTIFRNVTFISGVTGDTIDLTSVASGREVRFIDCKFVGDITLTYRTGDKISYTYPNANAPTYIDNATAVADQGVGYYYKLPSGEFKITY